VVGYDAYGQTLLLDTAALGRRTRVIRHYEGGSPGWNRHYDATRPWANVKFELVAMCFVDMAGTQSLGDIMKN